VTKDRWLGVLEVLSGGSGFVRRRDAGYLPSPDDVYVSGKLVSRFGLRTGDEISGSVGGRPKNGKAAPLSRLELVNDRPPEEAKNRPTFDRLSAQHPDEQLKLECGITGPGGADYTNRVIDLFCPFGKGQRSMIVAPAKAGKTTVLQSGGGGDREEPPGVPLFILLVDERPEEITEMEACGFGEVVASSFDFPADRHVARWRRSPSSALAVAWRWVRTWWSSWTRSPASPVPTTRRRTGAERPLSGGLDATSLERPKRLLGSARKIAQGRGLAHDRGDGPGGHRVPYGPGHLRGVQGDRQQ
jgi:transcription termination factor Rho